jgi:hypothetical protein
MTQLNLSEQMQSIAKPLYAPMFGMGLAYPDGIPVSAHSKSSHKGRQGSFHHPQNVYKNLLHPVYNKRSYVISLNDPMRMLLHKRRVEIYETP